MSKKTDAATAVKDDETVTAEMTAAVLSERKGRPVRVTKQATEVPDDEHSEPDIRPTRSSAGNDAGDDTASPDLEEEIATLAAEYGVDPRDIAHCESADEAEKACGAIYRAWQRLQQSQQFETPNSNGKPPAPEPEMTTEEELALALDDYEPDTSTHKNFKKLQDELNVFKKKQREQELAASKAQVAAFERARQQATLSLQADFQKEYPDLFGTQEKQTPRQMRNLAKATESGVSYAGFLGPQLNRMTPKQFVDRVAKLEFEKELAQTNTPATASTNGQRRPRHVAAPGRKASPATKTEDVPFDGPMEKDPNILRSVASAMARMRGER